MSKQFTQGYKTLAEQVKNSNTASKNLADSFEVMEEKVNSIEKKVFINAQRSPFLPTARKGRRPQVLKNRTDRVVREEEVLADSPDLFNPICYIFDAPLLSRATAQSMSEYMDTCHSEKDTVRNSGRAWAVIMYGLKTNWSRTEFRYGVGKQHANFRFKIATNCLKSAKDLPLSSLRSEYIASKNPTSSSTLQSTQSGISTGNSDSEEPFAWLQGSFVDKKSMREGRKHHKLRKSEFRARDGTADRKKAFYIADHIAKVVIDMLRFSRDRSKVRLFDFATHLLFDWTQYAAFQESDHIAPVLRSIAPNDELIDPTSITDCVVGSNRRAFNTNLRRFESLLDSRKELVLHATYKVQVSGVARQGRNKKRGIIETNVMKRTISLLRAALSFMETFCHCKEEIVLSSHSSMLRNVYRLSVFMRGMFADKLRDGANESPTAGNSQDLVTNEGQRVDKRQFRKGKDVANAQEERSDGDGRDDNQEDPRNTPVSNRTSNVIDHEDTLSPISPKDLLPGESEQEKTMGRVLKVTFETYRRLNIDTSRGGGNGIIASQTVESSDSDSVEDLGGLFDDYVANGTVVVVNTSCREALNDRRERHIHILHHARRVR